MLGAGARVPSGDAVDGVVDGAVAVARAVGANPTHALTKIASTVTAPRGRTDVVPRMADDATRRTGRAHTAR